MMMNPIAEIIKFNNERHLTTFDGMAEYKMLEEELHEFLHACGEDNEYEQVDALCDLIVIATGGLYKLGYSPTHALLETTKEILSREGSFNEETGKWEKDKNQDPDTLYKANYSYARRD